MDNTKEHPIILTAQEVNAVLAGHKTQHRMSIEKSDNTAILFDGRDWRYDGKEFIEDACCDPNPRGKHYFEQIKHIGNRTEFLEDYRSIGHCPLGKVGDRLWVQEPTLAIEDAGWIGPVFAASDDGRHAIDWGYGSYDDPAHIPACELSYNKPCDLKYEESRILLEITDIRIERVQDISVGDALKEGSGMNFPFEYWVPKHGEKSWLENPWVWVIEFKVVEPSEVTK